MYKDVLISIKGTVVSEDVPPDVIELVTAGNYYKKGGSRYISYNESEATGLAGVKTTLCIDGDKSVVLTRSGASNSELYIEKGRRHLCHYDTGYGELLVGISGCHINSMLDDKGGELFFNYTLDVNSSTVSQNEVLISVKEANKPDVKPDECSCN